MPPLATPCRPVATYDTAAARLSRPRRLRGHLNARRIAYEELVTESLEEYERLALALARDNNRLAALKEKLAHNRLACPLFDTDRFRRNLESAYTTMWRTWKNGEDPKAFAVAP